MTDKANINDIPVPKLYVSHERGRPSLISDLPRHARKRISKTWRRAVASDLLYWNMYGAVDTLPEAARTYITTLKMLNLI